MGKAVIDVNEYALAHWAKSSVPVRTHQRVIGTPAHVRPLNQDDKNGRGAVVSRSINGVGGASKAGSAGRPALAASALAAAAAPKANGS